MVRNFNEFVRICSDSFKKFLDFVGLRSPLSISCRFNIVLEKSRNLQIFFIGLYERLGGVLTSPPSAGQVSVVYTPIPLTLKTNFDVILTRNLFTYQNYQHLNKATLNGSNSNYLQVTPDASRWASNLVKYLPARSVQYGIVYRGKIDPVGQLFKSFKDIMSLDLVRKDLQNKLSFFFLLGQLNVDNGLSQRTPINFYKEGWIGKRQSVTAPNLAISNQKNLIPVYPFELIDMVGNLKAWGGDQFLGTCLKNNKPTQTNDSALGDNLRLVSATRPVGGGG